MPQPGPPRARPRSPGAELGSPSPAPYAPHGLVTDETALQLEWRVYVTRLGEVSARVSGGRTDGGGTATVLLHGAAGSWSTWTPLLVEAALLGRRLDDLVLIDLPGWGDSPPPCDPAAVGVEDYAQAVLDVLRSLGYQTWNVVGHSLGGFIALHLAAIEPTATQSVGLVSPTTFAVAEASRKPARSARDLPAFVGLFAVMWAFAHFGTAAVSLLGALRRIGLLRAVMSPLFARVASIPVSVVDALALEVRPAGFVQAARLAAEYDLEGSWRRIRCPVHSVRGDRDAFLLAGDDVLLAAVVTGLRVSVLPSAGHFGHIEAPGAVLVALDDSFSPRS
jgi:pimeloyl-ACP methyl ester carboxylesterase